MKEHELNFWAVARDLNIAWAKAISFMIAQFTKYN